MLPYAAALVLGLGGIAAYRSLQQPQPGPALLRAQQGAEDRDRAVRENVELLRHPDAQVRAAAAEQLGASDSAAAIPPLIQALADPSVRVRVAAARALGRMGSTATPALRALEQRQTDAEPAVREAAERALFEIRQTNPTGGP